MSRKAFLVDVEFCSGCQSCRLACQQERGFEDPAVSGIYVETRGPLHIEGKKWQYDWVPEFTEYCDMCKDRTSKGKDPTCVHHCADTCLFFGEFDELVKKANRKKMVIRLME